MILNVIVGFSVVDGRWRGREAILDLDFTISHRCKCQFCQKRFSLRVLAARRVCKQMTIVAMRPCCKTGAKVVLRRSTTLMVADWRGSERLIDSSFSAPDVWFRRDRSWVSGLALRQTILCELMKYLRNVKRVSCTPCVIVCRRSAT